MLGTAVKVKGVSIAALLERDTAACVWCGREPWARDLTAEHLLPRSRRGRGLQENLAVACRGCNRRRRSRQVAAYARAQLDAGHRPRFDLLDAALGRLSGSASRDHAAYGQRQRELLARVRSLAPALT
jgi:hypothetical protein